MKTIILTICFCTFFIVSKCGESSIECGPNVCYVSRIDCPHNNSTKETCSGELREFGAGFCGCCPYCLPFSDENDNCAEQISGFKAESLTEQNSNTARACRPPLICVDSVCKVKSAEFQENVLNSTIISEGNDTSILG